DDRVLDANLLARKLNPNFSIENITSLLYDLVSKGFINYDAATETVELKDKIFHYADASQKKVDFDIIKIVSESDETNAIFNLRDNTTSIMGVSQVELSRAQRVLIRPYGNFVKLKPNRDMDLEGLLFAGFSTLHGKDFHFDYNSFQIQLDSVRYFDLYLPTGTLDKFSMPNAYSIGSRIEHLNGVLLIDAPSNKSGRENISIFPILESKKNSYVFYDYKGTQAGAYDRKTFYFELDPFSFNSLDNYSKDDIRLKGKFLSADIFPVFHETLIIREDTSLGFITQTPTTGFRVYRNKGNYNGALELSNRGLLGRGNLSYLSASIDSKDLVFKPLQLTGSAESFNLKEDRSGQVEVPEVNGSDVTIDWRPYKDSMYIFSKQAPFEIFNQGIHEIKGMLILTPGGLKASGLLNWDKASMESNLFSLGAFSAQADTTDLKIKAFNADALALTTENLNGNVDFDKQMGNFSANANLLTTTLPYNQYQTSFNEFDWNMANETVTFRALEGNLGNFLSIHPDQDSLSFQGKSAFYDLRTNQLKIGGVPYIITSDAYIYPDSGNVDIQPNAEMKTLTNARIVADTVSKYHVINRASVQILGKKEYRASGFYEYNIGRHQQEIEFGEIIGSRIGKGSRSEKRSVTRANGEIGQRSDFYIDHKTKFHGTISLSSDKPNLRFKGFGQLQSSSLPEQNWFSFNCEGDKNNLTIIYDFPLNMEGEQLHTGLYISKETASVYPRVMMPLYFRKDRPIISIKGALQFDEKNDRFIFSDTSLLFGGSNHLDGNQLVFNNKNGNIEMAGKLEFGSALKYIDVDAAGFVQTDFPGMEVDSFFDAGSLESKLNIQAMVGIKLILPENLEKIMLADFKSSTFEASPIVYARNMSYYKKVVSELFPKNEDMRDVIDEINLGSLNLPKRFNPYTVLFDNVPLVWDRDYQSFVSTTDNLGIASITGDMVSMNVTAYLEMKMPTNEDDRLYFYIKSPSQQYYFFGYKQGILNVFSNNTRFMDELLSMKDKEKVFKMADGEQYEIQPVEPSTVQAFINRVKAAVPN
ncbi:MAG: hypothetical protein RLY31_3237, partial [Bacteroidota bacterium]